MNLSIQWKVLSLLHCCRLQNMGTPFFAMPNQSSLPLPLETWLFLLALTKRMWQKWSSVTFLLDLQLLPCFSGKAALKQTCGQSVQLPGDKAAGEPSVRSYWQPVPEATLSFPAQRTCSPMPRQNQQRGAQPTHRLETVLVNGGWFKPPGLRVV